MNLNRQQLDDLIAAATIAASQLYRKAARIADETTRRQHTEQAERLQILSGHLHTERHRLERLINAAVEKYTGQRKAER